jgi:hypothetical protein
MELTITAKQLGKKHPIIEKQIIEIDDIGNTPSVNDLIYAVVQQQVLAYNAKSTEKNLLPFLSESDIENQSASGKVGFGSIYNENKADLEKAQQTALQAFEDGLFAVFADDIQYNKPDEIISLEQGTVVTFIRLTFLAGSYW